MDSTITSKRRMKPVLYPQIFLEKKIQRKWQIYGERSKFVCLTKYFPKYYKRLELYDDSLTRPIQFKIKQLKIVNEFFCNGVSNHQKTFKKLFQGCRKTLKNLPSSDREQDPSLSRFFPNLKTIDLEGHQSYFNEDPEFLNYWIDFGDEDTEYFKWIARDYWKLFKRSYGSFWAGNRSVENLKVAWRANIQLRIIKKLNGLKKFLSSLKTLEFTLSSEIYNRGIEPIRLRILLMKQRNFLEHVTHLRIEYDGTDWEHLQSFIKCHPQLSFLSFIIPKEGPQSESYQNLGKDLTLNFNCFPKLQALEIRLEDFETLINRVEFSLYIREVTLATYSWTYKSFERILRRKYLTDPKTVQIVEVLEYVDDENGEVEEISQCHGHGVDFEDENKKDWKSFEQYKLLGRLFQKWKQLKDLKVLNLSLWDFSNMNIMMEMFILPLLRENAQLETLNCQLSLAYDASQEDKLFDLYILFEGIKSLRSLKNFSLTYREDKNPELFVLFGPGTSFFLTSLSSLSICARRLLQFDVFKFFRDVFKNLESQSKNTEKSVKLSRIRLHSTQELIKLLNLLDQISQYKNLQIDIEAELNIKSVDETISSFQFLRNLTDNIKVKVYLYDDWGGESIWEVQGVYSL